MSSVYSNHRTASVESANDNIFNRRMNSEPSDKFEGIDFKDMGNGNQIMTETHNVKLKSTSSNLGNSNDFLDNT